MAAARCARTTGNGSLAAVHGVISRTHVLRRLCTTAPPSVPTVSLTYLQQDRLLLLPAASLDCPQPSHQRALCLHMQGYMASQ